MLKGKKILLGISGSIAAYKSALLVRLLVKQGAQVRVIFTPAAHDFVTPLTFATLSQHPVLTAFQQKDTGTWNNHIELGRWADILVIAPASANTLAKMATGLCDNLLLATYLSARCQVMVAPAMDLDMLAHATTQANLDTLRRHDVTLITTNVGELASGLTGDGRMAEPEEIVSALENAFSEKKKLTGKRALVTAGPTYEALDPVRFIGNHSSGKMGFAIAEALAQQGATVDLVAGPTHQHTNSPHITLHAVTSADEMHARCQSLFSEIDIAVLSAAVADYKPSVKADQKIKKNGEPLTLTLVRTPDIAAELGKQKHERQILVGFALETEMEMQNARKKLEAKNFDFIVLNSLKEATDVFGSDNNKVHILSRNGSPVSFPAKSKKDVAIDIVNTIVQLYV